MWGTALYVLGCLILFAIVFLIGRHVLAKMALGEPWMTIAGLVFLLLCLLVLAGGFGAWDAPWRWRAALAVVTLLRLA